MDEKSSGHQPGVHGTPVGTNRGLLAGVPGISCCLFQKKLTFWVCQGHPAVQGDFRNFKCGFSYVPFLSLIYVRVFPSCSGFFGPPASLTEEILRPPTSPTQRISPIIQCGKIDLIYYSLWRLSLLACLFEGFVLRCSN